MPTFLAAGLLKPGLAAESVYVPAGRPVTRNVPSCAERSSVASAGGDGAGVSVEVGGADVGGCTSTLAPAMGWSSSLTTLPSNVPAPAPTSTCAGADAPDPSAG